MSSIMQKAGGTLGTRIITVMGAKSTGKTTFVCTGSMHAPKTLPIKEKVFCDDVVIFQNDTNGVLGPYVVGLEPNVIDFSDVQSVQEWDKRFKEAMAHVKPLFAEKKLRILGIDFSMMDKLWREQYVAKAEYDTPKSWDSVGMKSMEVYRQLRSLPNATIVAMTHINVAMEMASKQDPNALVRQQDARDAQSVGGARATATTDLSKSTKGVWWANSDAILAMKRKKVGDKVEHVVQVHPSNKVESGGRWESLFSKEEPAHLRTLLDKVYGPEK